MLFGFLTDFLQRDRTKLNGEKMRAERSKTIGEHALPSGCFANGREIVYGRRVVGSYDGRQVIMPELRHPIERRAQARFSAYADRTGIPYVVRTYQDLLNEMGSYAMQNQS